MHTLRLSPERAVFRTLEDHDHTVVLHRSSCLNCAARVEEHFTFCPACGQKTKVHRLALHDIFHEALHALTHADRGVLSLLKALALRPGVVARDYALEGKRKSYFNPFGFLVLMLGACVTVNAIFKPYKELAPRIRDMATPAHLAMVERQDKMFLFAERHVNVVTLAAVPVFALAYWLVFRRRGVRYAEILVAQAFFSGFVAAVQALIITPFFSEFGSADHYLLRVLFNLIYLSLAYRQMFRLRGVVGYLKSASASLLAMLAWSVVSMTLTSIYLRFAG